KKQDDPPDDTPRLSLLNGQVRVWENAWVIYPLKNFPVQVAVAFDPIKNLHSNYVDQGEQKGAPDFIGSIDYDHTGFRAYRSVPVNYNSIQALLFTINGQHQLGIHQGRTKQYFNIGEMGWPGVKPDLVSMSHVTAGSDVFVFISRKAGPNQDTTVLA